MLTTLAGGGLSEAFVDTEGAIDCKERLKRACRCCHELRQSHQIVGGGAEGEGSSDAVAAPEFRLILPGDGLDLDPAERLLDPLADMLAGGALSRKLPAGEEVIWPRDRLRP